MVAATHKSLCFFISDSVRCVEKILNVILKLVKGKNVLSLEELRQLFDTAVSEIQLVSCGTIPLLYSHI